MQKTTCYKDQDMEKWLYVRQYHKNCNMTEGEALYVCSDGVVQRTVESSPHRSWKESRSCSAGLKREYFVKMFLSRKTF